MGRRDNQQQNTQVLGRRDRSTQADTVTQVAAPAQRRGNFVTDAPSNIAAFARGEVKTGDVLREMPGVFKRGTRKTLEAVFPGLTEFGVTTGTIFGEGLRYAFDPEVREEYKTGRREMPEKIRDLTPREVGKKTIAAGIEASILKALPTGMKGSLAKRGGVGAVEGLGFAVAEGLAKGKEPEEMIEDAKLYGASGAALNVVAPWLAPVLRKEIGRGAKVTKEAVEQVKASKVVDEAVPAPERVTPQVPEAADIVPAKPVAPDTPVGKGVEVPESRLPIDGATDSARLEVRLNKLADEQAATNRTITNNVGEQLGANTNKEQIRRAGEAIRNMSAEQVDRIVRGVEPPPPGVLDTAFLHAAEAMAETINSPGLIRRVAANLAKRYGQEIQFVRNFDEMSPSKNIADIIAVRTVAAEKRLPKGETIKGAIANNVKKGKAQVTKSQIKIQQAEELLDSILC